MPVTKTRTLEAGNWEVAVDNVLIDSELLGEMSVTYTEGTTEIQTQAGNFNIPNGRVDEATGTITLILPNMDYLQVVFPDAYTAGTGTGTTGKIELGASCATPILHTINFHQVCASTDNDDIHVYGAYIQKSLEVTLSTDGAFELEIPFNAQKTANGVMRLGTGDVTQASVYDVTTQSTVPVTE